MRKYLIMILLISLVGIMFGQAINTFPWIETFDNVDLDFPMDLPQWNGWTSMSGVLPSTGNVVPNDVPSFWYPWNFANVSSNSLSMCYNMFCEDQNDWIITPAFDFSNRTKIYVLSFDIAITDFDVTTPPVAIGEDDYFAVVASINGGNSWNRGRMLYELDSEGLAAISNTGEQVSVVIWGFPGNNVKIGFYCESSLDDADYEIFIDNVKIEEYDRLNPVIALTSQINPNSVTLMWQPPDPGLPTWINEGAATLSTPGIDIFTKIVYDGDTHTGSTSRSMVGYNVYRGDVLLTDTPIGDLEYTDNDLADGNYIYSVTAVYEDVYEDNESNHKYIYVNIGDFSINFADLQPWTEGFEGDIFPPNGWSRIDADEDTYNWYIISPETLDPETAHSGEKCAASWSWAPVGGYGTGVNPDNWLITPAIDLSFGNAIGEDITWTLKYYIAPLSPLMAEETYSALLSTTGPAIEDFVIVLHTETFPDMTFGWHERTFDLTEYDGMRIWIAFRHHDTYNMMSLKLDDVSIEFEGEVTSDKDITTLPKARLLSNYPNPFNPSTTIKFGIRNSELGIGNVAIDIYNIKGQKVKSLVDGVYPAGEHSVTWNGTDNNGNVLSSGVYFARMKTADSVTTHKLLMMK